MAKKFIVYENDTHLICDSDDGKKDEVEINA